ncbi:MAG TPA: hypothetical protein VH414_12285 [Lichenihabitans sp.]|jgi:hypothetical protein|nr:hypothetical protein [Lichenihabitans sp.]
MRGLRILLASAILLGAIGYARADTTCASVRTDLTGPNVFGTHTMRQLSDSARAGNCNDAAYLVRRARDAQGFLETNCAADEDLKTLAADMVQLGRDTLANTTCQE